MEAVLIFVGLIFCLVPGLIAAHRGCKHQAGIWILSLLLGWTFIGWVVALIWAVSDPARATPESSSRENEAFEREQADHLREYAARRG